MFLVITLATLCLISAHVYDPELKLNYHVWSHHSPYEPESLIIKLYPHPSTEVSVGTIKCPINVSWDPSKPLSPAQFSKHIQTCWTKYVAESPDLDDTQITNLTAEQLMILLYRNKTYSDGHVRIAYRTATKTDKPGLFFDLPPITPGEYRCAAWHQETLYKSYMSKKKRYDQAAEYLVAIGQNAADFKKWPEYPQMPRISVLVAEEESVKDALPKICMKLAQAHVELAKRLYDRQRKNLAEQVVCARTTEFVQKLPDLPLFILPLADFIAIKTFLDTN